MTSQLLLLVLLAVHGMLLVTGEKYLLLEMAPDIVYPGCSPTFMLRCSRNSTAAGHDDTVTLNDVPVDDTGVSWTSLVLSKGGQSVAFVTLFSSQDDYTPAQLNTPVPGVSVEGRLLNNDDDSGYLDVTWSAPTAAQSGEYTCTAHGTSMWGYPVQYTVSARVDIGDYTISNDTGRLDYMSYQVEEQRKLATSLTGTLGTLNDTISDQDQRIDTQTLQITALTQTVDSLNLNAMNGSQEELELQEQQILNLTTAVDALATALEIQTQKLAACSQNVAFHALQNATGIYLDNSTVVYQTVLVNIGGDYDDSTGIFKCSVAGTYIFNVHTSTGTLAQEVRLSLFLNNDDVGWAMAGVSHDNIDQGSMSAVLDLTSGDEVKVVTSGFSYLENTMGERTNMFNGVLIYAVGC